MDLFDNLKQKVAGANKTIVFPEGQEPRIFRAAIRLKNDGLVVPILLGKVDEIKQNVENEGVDLGD
ncbi:phosphate acetyltransferase, partial [Lactobacillus salivarius]|nr:phosphate acetyltransferase [Ligilactobacillus salivarius]